MRCENALSMELRATQLTTESTVELRERAVLLRLRNEVQAALKHQRAHKLTEHHQLAQEGRARRSAIPHQKDGEERAYT